MNAHMTAQAELRCTTSRRWYPSRMRDDPELVVVVDGEAGVAFLELECD